MAWSGREGTLLCCALLTQAEPLITIPPRSDTQFYEQFAVLGRTTEAVRGRLYELFPDRMSEAKIREAMRISLRDWGPEAAGTDAMDVAEKSTAAPVLSGKRGAGQGRGYNFSSKRPKPPDKEAGTCDAALTAHPASKVAVGA